MKTFLLLLFLSALPCLADLPCTYDDIVNLYGEPVRGNQGARPIGISNHRVGTHFNYEGIDITLTFSGRAGVKAIKYVKPIALSPLEVESLLKPLSTDEDWVKQGDKDWSLPKAGAKAHWDGEGKLMVTSP